MLVQLPAESAICLYDFIGSDEHVYRAFPRLLQCGSKGKSVALSLGMHLGEYNKNYKNKKL